MEVTYVRMYTRIVRMHSLFFWRSSHFIPITWKENKSSNKKFSSPKEGGFGFVSNVHCAVTVLWPHASIQSKCNSYLWLSTCIVSMYTRPVWIRLIYGLYGGTFARRRSLVILRVRKRERLPSITHAMCTRSTHPFPFPFSCPFPLSCPCSFPSHRLFHRSRNTIVKLNRKWLP